MSAKDANKQVDESKAVEPSVEEIILRDGADPRARPERITRELVEKKGTLVVPKSVVKPGFKYFWMKDSPGRYEELSLRGYRFVTDSVGKRIRRARAGGEVMLLLDIPVDLWEQLRELKNEQKLLRTKELMEIKNPYVSGKVGIYEKEFIVK